MALRLLGRALCCLSDLVRVRPLFLEASPLCHGHAGDVKRDIDFHSFARRKVQALVRLGRGIFALLSGCCFWRMKLLDLEILVLLLRLLDTLLFRQNEPKLFSCQALLAGLVSIPGLHLPRDFMELRRAH